MRGQQRPVYSPSSLPPSQLCTGGTRPARCDLPPSSPDCSQPRYLSVCRPTHSDTPSAGCQVTAALCCVSPCTRSPVPLRSPPLQPLHMCFYYSHLKVRNRLLEVGHVLLFALLTKDRHVPKPWEQSPGALGEGGCEAGCGGAADPPRKAPGGHREGTVRPNGCTSGGGHFVSGWQWQLGTFPVSLLVPEEHVHPGWTLPL